MFYDENAILFFDEEHSDEEERYILLGYSENLKMLVVCHCYIQDKEVIRIDCETQISKTKCIEICKSNNPAQRRV